MAEQPLVILDTPALYYRAFYALPSSLTAPDGTPVNAVRGLVDIIGHLITRLGSARVVAAWDSSWRPAFRTDLLPSYKAHRITSTEPEPSETPDDLLPQLPLIQEALELAGIPVLGATGYEADDVIATLAANIAGPVVAVSSDRDLVQLVDDSGRIQLLLVGKKMAEALLLDGAAVIEKFGVPPSAYLELAAVRGDKSDGIPGVPGIGDKTAAQLLTGYGNLEAVLTAAAEGGGPHGLSPRRAGLLAENADAVRLGLRVMTAVRDVPLETERIAALPSPGRDAEALSALTAQHSLGAGVGRLLAAQDAAGPNGPPATGSPS